MIDWGLPDTVEGRQALDLIQVLRELWFDRRERETCLQSLPTLAEALRACGPGYEFEARVAELDWELYRFVALRLPVDDLSFLPIDHWVTNTRRVFWFPPRTIEVPTSGPRSGKPILFCVAGPNSMLPTWSSSPDDYLPFGLLSLFDTPLPEER